MPAHAGVGRGERGSMRLIQHETGCVCKYEWCVCDDDERLIRARLGKNNLPPLTAEERGYLIDDAVYCAKGDLHAKDLELLPDNELCQQVLYAWASFARKHGML